jgi:poly(A) polymerase
MLRALRFAAKLEFTLDPKTEKPLFALKHLLQHVPPARLFEEYLKLFLSGAALTCFRLLRQHDFLGIFFPALAEALISEQGPWVERFVHHALQDTDARLIDDRPVSPVFLIAVFLWPKVKQENIDIVLDLQQQHLSIPKRLLQMAVEIWRMQSRLAHIVPKHTARLLTHPRFRAAYDFFCLRARSGEDLALTPVATWWTQYVEGAEENRLALLAELPHPVGTKPKKRSRRRFYKLK